MLRKALPFIAITAAFGVLFATQRMGFLKRDEVEPIVPEIETTTEA